MAGTVEVGIITVILFILLLIVGPIGLYFLFFSKPPSPKRPSTPNKNNSRYRISLGTLASRGSVRKGTTKMKDNTPKNRQTIPKRPSHFSSETLARAEARLPTREKILVEPSRNMRVAKYPCGLKTWPKTVTDSLNLLGTLTTKIRPAKASDPSNPITRTICP
ncbi:MAG: hypothetical protein OK438_02275 [Thaumarchaeota archaeon]|nr:hypothetical protein [Nitrososphaerota archaeon]